MSRIYTTTQISKPIEQVFDYITTAGNWPNWHPSSMGVTGAVDHSGEVGEQITEKFLVAGRRGDATWTVRERQTPTRWVIEGSTTRRGGGTITYTLTSKEGGTFFEREFIYHFGNPVFNLVDALFMRPRIAAESAEALRQLKKVLES